MNLQHSVSVAVLAMVLTGCSTESELPLFFAAASLADVTTDWQAACGDGHSFSHHTGASIVLANQIRTGASADFFLPAGLGALKPVPPDMMVKVDSGFLHNHMVLVTAPGTEPPATLADLLDAQYTRIALADPEMAPAGEYARTGLQRTGLWQTLRARFLFTGDVRMATEAVRLGSADAGIVYATEVQTWDPQAILQLDTNMFPPARYPLVMIAPRSPRKDSIWAFLHSQAGRHIAAEHGFQ